ncbi:hypothetical protein K469DRAFT_698628, partial [Zopfia rhizophila CBS 207.26]
MFAGRSRILTHALRQGSCGLFSLRFGANRFLLSIPIYTQTPHLIVALIVSLAMLKGTVWVSGEVWEPFLEV